MLTNGIAALAKALIDAHEKGTGYLKIEKIGESFEVNHIQVYNDTKTKCPICSLGGRWDKKGYCSRCGYSNMK